MTADRTTRRGFRRANSLTLGFGAAFLIVLAAQAVAGRAEFNEQLAVEGLQQIGLGDHLMSSDFAVDVTENRQSEFLRFFLYVFGTVHLFQRGSPEAKGPHKAGAESERERIWPRWPSSPSTRAGAVHRSPSPSAPRTTPPAPRADVTRTPRRCLP